MDPAVHLSSRTRRLPPPNSEGFLSSFRRLSLNHRYPAQFFSQAELKQIGRLHALGDFADELLVIILSYLRAAEIQKLSHTSTSTKRLINGTLINKVAKCAYNKKVECFVVPTIQGLYMLECYRERGSSVNTGSIHSIVVHQNLPYGFGANANGQLGLNNTQSFGIPKQIELRNVSVVACGDAHTVILCWDSSLYTFGRGKCGALGHGTDADIVYPKQLSFFHKLKNGGAPRMVAAGQDHTLVVSNGLYGFGWNDFHQLGGTEIDSIFTPKLISDVTYRDVDGGFGHTLAANRHGMWSIGLNTHGQLGLGHRATGISEFTKVEFPEGMEDIEVERVSCGSYHNLVLTRTGTVYSFGHGAQGKLGVGDSEDRLVPAKVDGFLNRVIHIHAGNSHSLCIDADHRLYAFGMGRRGQLGVGEKSCVLKPMVVKNDVVEASAGGYHSLIKTKDKVEACGRATRGQLGILEDFSNERDHHMPVSIRPFTLPGETPI